MKYKLINPEKANNQLSLVEQVFVNRGFNLYDIEPYLHVSDEDIYPPTLLDNMREGAQMLMRHISAEDQVYVVIDSDADGYTSSAIFINYLYELFPGYTLSKLRYGIHPGKEHGLIPAEIPEGIKLVICPDSSSNSVAEVTEMAERGIDVLVLDHHESDEVPPQACVINNQLCGYPNKSLSGAGVVYKFCSYIDELLNEHVADKFLDLASIGMIADVMDLTNRETRQMINKGLSNLENTFLLYENSAQSFSIDKRGGLMPFTVSFYIAPYINATIRMGTYEQKMTLFESMLTFKALEKVPSTKRGHKGEEELRVEQAVRQASNLKNKQNASRDEGLEIIENIITNEELLNNPVLIIKLRPEFNINKTMTGLIANILANNYKRPCIILNLDYNKELNKMIWEGSARGYEKSELKDFRNWLLNSTCVSYAQG